MDIDGPVEKASKAKEPVAKGKAKAKTQPKAKVQPKQKAKAKAKAKAAAKSGASSKKVIKEPKAKAKAAAKAKAKSKGKAKKPEPEPKEDHEEGEEESEKEEDEVVEPVPEGAVTRKRKDVLQLPDMVVEPKKARQPGSEAPETPGASEPVTPGEHAAPAAATSPEPKVPEPAASTAPADHQSMALDSQWCLGCILLGKCCSPCFGLDIKYMSEVMRYPAAGHGTH